MELYITPEQKIAVNEVKKTSVSDVVKAFAVSNSAGIIELLKNDENMDKAGHSYFRWLGQQFFDLVIKNTDLDSLFDHKSYSVSDATIELWHDAIPPLKGAEYLSKHFLSNLFSEFLREIDIQSKKNGLRQYLENDHSNWFHVGKICFHLAENPNNKAKPFAFLVTYSTKGIGNKVKHVPLNHAIKQYINDKDGLLKLLLPVQEAAQISPLIKDLYKTKKIFQPQLWNPSQAYKFLQGVSDYEKSGVIVRVPTWWRSRSQSRVKVKVTIGDERVNKLGVDALLDFNVALSAGDLNLSLKDWEEISQSEENLVQVKGRWLEINPELVNQTLDKWKHIKEYAKLEGISFTEAMRLMSKAAITEDEQDINSHGEWCEFVAGKGLKKKLLEMKDPGFNGEFEKTLESKLQATLRPYQKEGVAWMWFLYSLDLGGCLADDMGLGKTIQTISLFLLAKQQNKSFKSLLVLPTSLLSNWQSEIEKFAPSLKFKIYHSSAKVNPKLIKKDDISETDLIITTYGSIGAFQSIKDVNWDLMILDEAQAIKNSTAKQTKIVKSIPAKVRIILTGTPVENKIEDLWSLFDFSSPGLLGNKKEFRNYTKSIIKDGSGDYSSIRKLVQPYILRRLKTDSTIIKDLPEKTEVKTYCRLSKAQLIVYEQTLNEFKEILEDEEISKIKRKGLVLSYLTRFKQICNHPDQLSGSGEYNLENSGKLLRLSEICEEISERQERLLIFTQYSEITDILDYYLSKIFNQKGYVLHGGTSVKKRKELVESFQSENGAPYFVLSLKAGGTGLNLTRANHVIHFDRWWNPAVENQATDRAFRIGQKKNVLVHKFITKGTIEEKIDVVIEEKKSLANSLIEDGSEMKLTELTNEELLSLVSLDINDM